MEIETVRTYVIENPPPHRGGHYWTLLKLVTDEGTEGLGEAYGVPFHPDVTARMIRDIGERHVIGTSPFEVERLFREIYLGSADTHTPHHPDLVVSAMISAFEMACLDIVGKELGQPIYNLIGGKFHDELRSYTYLYPDEDAPDDFDAFTNPALAASRAEAYVDMGFTAIKFDPVLPMRADFPQQIPLSDLARAADVVRSVREAVGNECELLIGTHGQLSTASAIRFASMIEEYHPLWFEEPVPPENRAEMGKVASATDIPVATGERLATKYEFRDLLEAGGASILQPATGRVGGILEGKKIAGMAEAHYAHVAPHLWAGPVEAAANVQLDTCSPNFLIQECIETLDGFHGELLEEPIEWRDGYVVPPTDPGLGIELDEDVAEAHGRIETVSG
jgi:2-dehydro-3-deoxyphosphogalactonate aldolase